jgi:hypothetical protein
MNGPGKRIEDDYPATGTVEGDRAAGVPENVLVQRMVETGLNELTARAIARGESTDDVLLAFRLTGPAENGGPVRSVTWDDGELSGDRQLVEQALRLVEDRELIGRTPTGPFITANLTDPADAFVTLADLFYSYTVDGDVPELEPLPELPPGAVALRSCIPLPRASSS